LENNTKRKRERSVGHLWCDKRVMRFFRKNFEKKSYKALRNVYLALCEIESDFSKTGTDIKYMSNIRKTTATYAGMDTDNTGIIMQHLRKMGMIDYGRRKDSSGRVKGSFLSLFVWEDFQEELDEYLKYEVSIAGKNLLRKKPSKEKTGHIKNNELTLSKNDSKESTINKNHCSEFVFSKENTLREAQSIQTPSRDLFKIDRLKKKESLLNNPLRAESEQLLNLWKHHGFCTQNKKKEINLLEKVLSGVYFGDPIRTNKFSLTTSEFSFADIERSIQSYSEYCVNNGKDKTKIPLSKFFYDPNVKKKDGDRGISSFLIHLNGCRRAAPVSIEDENPIVTHHIMTRYRDLILAGSNAKFTTWEENNFVKAAKFVVDFKEVHKFHLMQGYGTGVNSIAKNLVDCIFESWNEDVKKMKVHFLNQKNNETLLIQYLQDKGIMDNKATAQFMKG